MNQGFILFTVTMICCSKNSFYLCNIHIAFLTIRYPIFYLPGSAEGSDSFKNGGEALVGDSVPSNNGAKASDERFDLSKKDAKVLVEHFDPSKNGLININDISFNLTTKYAFSYIIFWQILSVANISGGKFVVLFHSNMIFDVFIMNMVMAKFFHLIFKIILAKSRLHLSI